jgi:hypothetical protein
VIFEDLHWIDSETQALLDGLIESLGSARLLLLVSYRPEYQHTWDQQDALQPDAPRHAPGRERRRAAGCVAGSRSGTRIAQATSRQARQPVLPLEETIRTLVETNVLVGERGAYRVMQPIQTLQIRSTVQTILAARIDRLSPDLGGHFKSGQTSTPQNRPRERALKPGAL